MSTISASTASNTAFKVTSDTTGTLVFQTGAVPTTAISIDASQVVSIGNIAVTGATTFAAGSAAAPSITTTGDTNTGIFFPAADTIGFSEGGVEAARFNSSGVFTTTNDATIQGLTVGRGAGAVSTNTAVGASALAANTTGTANTAIGNLALKVNTTGVGHVSVGHDSLALNTTGSDNTAVGRSALSANTTGNSNTGLGYFALVNSTTASNNTAVGYQAGYTNTTGTENQAFGANALDANTTGNSNSAFGLNSLGANTTASNNSGYGVNSLRFNTTGASNVAVGADALQANTTSSNNTAVGYRALYSQTTSASSNVAVGYQAGYSVTTGGTNVVVGELAGYALVTGASNTFIGVVAGYSSTGSNNTFIGSGSNGFGAGWVMTTGSKNTILGGYSGNQNSLDIRTSSNYIVLSDGDGVPYVHTKSTTGYGSNSPNAYVRGTLNWGTSGAEGSVGLHCSKVISADNSTQVTVRAKITASASEWQPGYVFVRVASYNADATGGAAAWYLVLFRIYNGSVQGFSVQSSGGSTGSFTLTVSDATSGTTSYGLLNVTAAGSNNRTVMDVEIVDYNYIIDATRA